MRLSLYDFRDIDLLMKIADESDDEGWIETRTLAESLGAEDGEKVNGVGIRLSWMRKFGMLSYDEKTHLWRLSGGGERVLRSRLKAAQAKTIDAIPDEALVDVMAHVTTRYRLGDPIMATMLRREFQFGTSPRSRVWNGQ